MKRTNYSINFNYMEQVLLDLGKDYKELIEDMELYEKGILKRYSSTLYLVKRMEYLKSIMNHLNEIANDVNEETKNLINLLYMENKSFKEVEKITGIKEKRILFRHNLIVDEMMILVGSVSEDESKRHFKKRKNIPVAVKNKVFERDNGKCVECDSTKDLHYHHIKRYANGGKNTVDNLILLCSGCHAEEHKNERSYYLLKAMVSEVNWLLAYLDNELSNKDKRNTIKLMRQYRKLDAIIQSKESRVEPSHTVEFKEKVQSSNQFRSEVENAVMASIEVDNYKQIKRVLDLAYDSVTPLQQEIWNEHFTDGLPDAEVYYGRNIAKRTYYEEKRELIKIVAECLRVAQISTKNAPK